MPSLFARLLHSTRLVDWAYRRFDGIRRELVLSLASDGFLEVYNDLCYAASDVYRPDSERFRAGLFSWEEDAFARRFPGPPARVLVGAAGGGREAFALAARGYAVVAFEPSDLVVRMAAARQPGMQLQAYRGRYADLPRLRGLDGTVVDLAGRPFDAGVIGWGSFSHLPSDQQRIDVMRAYAALVDGPVLVSFLGRPASSQAPPPTGLRRLLHGRRGDRRPGTTFWVDVGVCRHVTPKDLHLLAEEAGVAMVHVDFASEWPNAIFMRATPRLDAVGDRQADTP